MIRIALSVVSFMKIALRFYNQNKVENQMQLTQNQYFKEWSGVLFEKRIAKNACGSSILCLSRWKCTRF